MHLLTLQLIFIGSRWRIYVHIKFHLRNESSARNKKGLLFNYIATQKNSGTLSATLLKLKNEKKNLNLSEFLIIDFDKSHILKLSYFQTYFLSVYIMLYKREAL